MRRSPLTIVVLLGIVLALAARTPAPQGTLSQAHAYLPFVARHEPPRPTPN
ncbi:MAG TPA: hypothetical protein VMY98_07580 [Anaerolineae bacterium]|nr:hypothetical protein [Anaerolineae bacterium]